MTLQQNRDSGKAESWLTQDFPGASLQEGLEQVTFYSPT